MSLKNLPPFLWIVSLPIVVRALFRPLSDPDLWWHLAAGREMVNQGRLLDYEIFSFTLLGAPWINFEWGTEILYFWIVDAAGFWGFFVFCHLFFAAILAALFFSLNRKSAPALLILALFWIGFDLLNYRFDARAGLVTLLFFPVFIRLGMGAGTIRTLPIIIFVLTVVWVNCHAGVLYGAGLLFAFAVGARWARKDKKTIRLLDWSFLASLAAVFVTPYGPRYFQMVAEVLANRHISQAVLGEWTSPPVAQFPTYWVLFLATSGIMVYGLIRKSASARFWAPALFMFLVWSSGQARSTPLLGFVALPFLADLLKNQKRGIRVGSILICLVFIGKYGGSLFEPFPSQPVQWRNFPVGAASFIEKSGLRGRAFTTLRYGDYYTWALGPDRKTFVYGSYLFLPVIAEAEEFFASEELRPREARAFVEKYQFDFTLTPYSTPSFLVKNAEIPEPLSRLEIVFPKEDWALIYFDDNSLIFLKRIPAHAALIEEHEYTALWPVNRPLLQRRIHENRIDRETYRKELDRHRGAAGETRVGRILGRMLDSEKVLQ